MRTMIRANEMDLGNNQKFNAYNNPSMRSADLSERNPVSEILATEGYENMSIFLQELGLASDQNVVILSSQHHYYYDEEEMKNVKTIINLKVLNQVKELKSLLNSIFSILGQNSYFIGCFVDNKRINGYELGINSSASRDRDSFDYLENGIVSHIPFINMLYSIMDLKTNKFMSFESVSTILEEHGFKVLDMKEINGLTYFHSQKVGSTDK